jgi:hypothetical protein
MSRLRTISAAVLVALTLSACSEQDRVELIRAIHNPDPDPGERFGKALRRGVTYVVPVERDDPQGLQEAGTVYVFARETGALLQTINSPDPQAGAHFGAVVLTSTDFVIAAPDADVAGVIDAGAIFVYDDTGELLRAIPNPEPIANDHFGRDMITIGSGFVVRVAGPTGDGRIYFFHHAPGSDGTELEELVISDPEPNTTEEFGKTMYAARQRLVVGSPAATIDGIVEAGLVGVYDLDAFAGPARVGTVANPAPSEGARFGTYLGAAGSNPVAATGAGSPLLVVLTPGSQETPTAIFETFADAGVIRGFGDLFSVGFSVIHPDEGAGSVALYTPDGARPIPNPDPQDADRFGSDVVYDSVSRELILSPSDDRDGLVDAGSVFVVHTSTPRGSEYFLPIPSPSPGAAFGTSVAYTSGGILVSAPGEDDVDVDEAGAAYVFEYDVPRFRFRIPNPEPGAHDRFGDGSLAGLGDTFMIGAMGDDPDGVVDAGSIYLFRITPE